MNVTEELKPCPFCGGKAERVDIDDGDNAGGSFVHCTECDASGNVEFGFKENFVSNWNRRAALSHAPSGAGEAVDLPAYFERQIEWSRQTFGPALRTKGVIDHIRKELREIEQEPHDLTEWVDVVILAMDGFWRHGGDAHSLLPALISKQQKNMARVWPDWRTMSEDSAIEHDRSADALPATEEKAADVKPEAAGSWSIASAGPWHVENWNASAYTSVGIAKDGEVKAIAVSVGDADEGDYIVAALNAYASPIPAPPSELVARCEAGDGWNPIATCPIREPVDLWCVYGGEEFAQYEGGASIGKLVPNRIKTKEYGFFGNQSDNGVPQRDAPDLVPVAWRKAVPDCPATIIAEALHIPVTLEDARSALSGAKDEREGT